MQAPFLQACRSCGRVDDGFLEVTGRNGAHVCRVRVDAEDHARLRAHAWRRWTKGHALVQPQFRATIRGRKVRLENHLLGLGEDTRLRAVRLNGDPLDFRKANLQRIEEIGPDLSQADAGIVGVPLRDKPGRLVGYAYVDTASLDLVRPYRWSLDGNGYVVTTRREGGRHRELKMHRLLCGLDAGDPRVVDHVDHDATNNTLANLRVCTRAQNAQNLAARSAKPRGVYHHKRMGKWFAVMVVFYERRFLGYFDTEEAADLAVSQARAEAMPFSAEAGRRRAAACSGREAAGAPIADPTHCRKEI